VFLIGFADLDYYESVFTDVFLHLFKSFSLFNKHHIASFLCFQLSTAVCFLCCHSAQ